MGSAGVGGDPLYLGSVASISGDVLTFETSTDSDGVTTNPFVPGTLASGAARLKAAISGGAVSGLTDEDGDPISGTNSEGSSLDDANPPSLRLAIPTPVTMLQRPRQPFPGVKLRAYQLLTQVPDIRQFPTLPWNVVPMLFV